MTPKMSYRRNNIIRDYDSLLANCYAEDGDAVSVKSLPANE